MKLRPKEPLVRKNACAKVSNITAKNARVVIHNRQVVRPRITSRAIPPASAIDAGCATATALEPRTIEGMLPQYEDFGSEALSHLLEKLGDILVLV